MKPWDVARVLRFDAAAQERARTIFIAWYREKYRTQARAAAALRVNQSTISSYTAGTKGLGAVLISAVAQIAPDVALQMLGAAQSPAITELADSLEGMVPPERRLVAAQIAMAISPDHADKVELRRIAIGVVGFATLFLSDESRTRTRKGA